MTKIIFWTSLSIVLYTYIGYPLLLFFWTKLQKNIVKKGSIEPSVSIIIPAYNEEKIIAQKIENCLGLNYPPDKLEIIVMSDGSTDRTDDIVVRYREKGVILKRLDKRSGKIVVLNKSVPEARGEIVVLCDANTIFRPDAIRMLIRNFYDESVGAVSGDVRLLNEDVRFGKSEGLYYKLERFIQTKESQLHSIIGVDGGMYALRKKLYKSSSNNIILDDFVISMEVINQGFRVIYEPEAVATEKSPPSPKEEFRRRIRVAAGCFQTLFQREGVPSLSSPIIIFEYISHKLLRWIVPFLLIFLFWSNLLLISITFYRWILFLQVCLYFSALIGSKIHLKIFSLPFYFCLTNMAIIMGFLKALIGKQSAKWEPVR